MVWQFGIWFLESRTGCASAVFECVFAMLCRLSQGRKNLPIEDLQPDTGEVVADTRAGNTLATKDIEQGIMGGALDKGFIHI